MPKVRYLTSTEEISNGGGYVVIRPTPNGRFLASGSVPEKRGGTFYQTAAYNTLKEAIAEATEWASRKGIAVVNVVDCVEAEGS